MRRSHASSQRTTLGWLAFLVIYPLALGADAGGGQPPKLDEGSVYSLADDFSIDRNRKSDVWSYRLIRRAEPAGSPSVFAVNRRTANELWGSNFPSPPRMWSDAEGYWGIGRNDSGRALFSTRNSTAWAPGVVLLHPKGGEGPSGLAICWTAPRAGSIAVRCSFRLAATGSNGIGVRLVKQSREAERELVALRNIGRQIANVLEGVTVAAGDQLRFELDTCGDPSGDIVEADVVIRWSETPEPHGLRIEPQLADVAENSQLTFSVESRGAKSIRWLRNGVPVPGATQPQLRIDAVDLNRAGQYSAIVDAATSQGATLRVTRRSPLPEPFASHTPRQRFAETLAEQEEQLKTNALMVRFAESRKRLAVDRYRPAYHFVSPESQLNDPNGLCHWQGRWHLFYQGYPPDEFPAADDIARRRQHWGHAVSDDLVHWRDLPYAIYPGVERMCFSGGTVVDGDRVVAFYPGIGAGQMVAVASDPLLLNWRKLGDGPVHGSPAGDACIWKEGATYYGLVGADQLVSSRDLLDWKVEGPFLHSNPFPLGDAAACPGFLPLGNKHLLVSFSHTSGGQYLLGNYDAERHKFQPDALGRFNHGRVSPGGVHAPCAVADGKGGAFNLLNINDGKPSSEWDQIMSLTQRLSLGPDSQLRIAPVDAIATLRGEHRQVGETVLPANQELVLPDIVGNTLELQAEFDPREARCLQLNVLRSPAAEEQTSITFYNFDRALSIWYQTPSTICLDGTRSSELPDVWLRPPEQATFHRGGQPLSLRVFVDRSVVEVFVNEKLYLAIRVYPRRADSVGVSVRAQGQGAVLKRLDAWQMKSLWP